jgi:hypothetical protein
VHVRAHRYPYANAYPYPYPYAYPYPYPCPYPLPLPLPLSRCERTTHTLPHAPWAPGASPPPPKQSRPSSAAAPGAFAASGSSAAREVARGVADQAVAAAAVNLDPRSIASRLTVQLQARDSVSANPSPKP